MGEPKLHNDYYENDDSPYSPKQLTARERAEAMGWGIDVDSPEDDEPSNEDLEQAEAEPNEEPKKSARERADERWGGKKDETQNEPNPSTDKSENPDDTETPFSFKNDGVKKTDSKAGSKKKKKLLIASGVGGLFVILTVFLIFLSSLKLVNFGEVLEATAYARSNSVMQERMTQNIFDASVVEGEGSATLSRSLVDKFFRRNVNNELAKAGRENRFTMTYKDGALEGTRIGDATISLDEITRKLGFGESYAEVADGFTRLNPSNVSKAMRVRYEFTNHLQAAVQEEFALDARYVRSRLFGTISDNIGFKFSGWRQAARDYLGKTPAEANLKNRTDQVEEIVPNEPINTGVEALDKVNKKMREKLKAALENKGGNFEEAKLRLSEGIAADIETATKIQSVASDVSVAVLVSTLACMTREAFSMENIKATANQNEQQASLMTLNFQSRVDQVKEGLHIQPEAVSAAVNQLDGAETSPAYLYATNQSKSISNTVDTPLVKPKVNESLYSLINTLTAPPILNIIPFTTPDEISDAVCGFLLSPEGAIAVGVTDIVATAVSGFFSGGAAAVAREAGGISLAKLFMQELGKSTFGVVKNTFFTKAGITRTGAMVGGFATVSFGLNLIASSVNGTTFTGAEDGPDYVERTYIGGNILQERRLRTLGGKPISNADATAQDKVAMNNLRTKWNNKSFIDRFANIHNPFSFIGLLSSKVPTSLFSMKGGLSSILSNVGNVFSGVMKPALSFLGPTHVYADSASSYSPYYDNVQYGFSSDELAKMQNDPSYSIAHNEEHITEEQIRSFDSSIGKCFDGTISQTDITDESKYPECTAANLSADDLVFRYRIHLLDSGLGEVVFNDDSGVGGGNTTPVATTPPASIPGLNGYTIQCTPTTPQTVVPTISGTKLDWSGIRDSGSIGNDSAGNPIKVYVRNACDSTNMKTIVIVGGIHGIENGGQPVAARLLFNAQLPANVRIIAIPQFNGSGIARGTRRNSNGVDLNRNQDYRWGDASADADCLESLTSCKFYHGTSVSSEPETKAIDAFLLSVGKANLFAVYHDDRDYVAPVLDTPVSIGNAYALATGMTGKDTGTVGRTVPVNQHGSLDGWYNSKTGTPSLLVELGHDQSSTVIDKHVNAILQMLHDGII